MFPSAAQRRRPSVAGRILQEGAPAAGWLAGWLGSWLGSWPAGLAAGLLASSAPREHSCQPSCEQAAPPALRCAVGRPSAPQTRRRAASETGEKCARPKDAAAPYAALLHPLGWLAGWLDARPAGSLDGLIAALPAGLMAGQMRPDLRPLHEPPPTRRHTSHRRPSGLRARWLAALALGSQLGCSRGAALEPADSGKTAADELRASS